MLVVDTNILASLFVDGPFSNAARSLYAQDADWHSEPFILVEFTNVLTTQIRAGRLAPTAAPALFERGRAVLGEQLRAVEHVDALTAAARWAISAYDARFICAAQALGSPLVTEDAALRRKVPAETLSIAEALA